MDVPDFLVRDAERFAASGAEPAVPRLAATVLLLRAGPAGAPEVYLMRRAATMTFAPGRYVFPGGSVDPRDAGVALAVAGPAVRGWAERLGQPEAQAQAIVCAAVREVFEECGVLLAGADPSTVVANVSTVEWETARAAVHSGDLAFADLLASRGLVLRGDLLAPWTRWITPEFEPRRFDTYFFVARLPEGQATREVGGEADHGLWRAPGQARDLPMMPPTIVTLSDISAYSTVDDILAAAALRDAATPVTPRLQGNRLII
jgi:8-oxo-dGTP pyrophosphatase MutT (NUDIX family)